MKKKGILLVLTLILVFAVVQAASAAGGMGFGKRQGNIEEINPVEQLELSEEQVSRWIEIHDDAYEQTREMRINMMDLRHELRKLMLQGEDDQIEAKKSEMEELRSDIVEVMQESRQECRSLLTEEQLEKFENIGPRGNRQGKMRFGLDGSASGETE